MLVYIVEATHLKLYSATGNCRLPQMLIEYSLESSILSNTMMIRASRCDCLSNGEAYCRI
jgi:hypothetical protein